MKPFITYGSPIVAAVLLSLLASFEPAAPTSEVGGSGPWTLVGWNDLGMHCMDGDYSVFSILPPYNTVEAQLLRPNGDLVTNASGITVTYEAVADPEGSMNRSSEGKTNYWQFAQVLYGAAVGVNEGLAGNDMPGAANTPQPMTFEPGDAVFRAEGIPITPYDDGFRKRYYPLMRLVARDTGGVMLASSDVVLPVSDEMDCRACHATDGQLAAMPVGGWVRDPNPERDFRLNVLKLHDDLEGANPAYQAALVSAGLDSAGLHATATAATGARPILCASCHRSNALPGTGLPGVSPLTSAIHSRHSQVVNPANNLPLDSELNRSACYTCHPGSDTRCLRGAMGSAVATNGTLAMQCQSCHGNMSAVGSASREGWFEEPNCQSCHTGTAVINNGQIRYEDVIDPATGQPRVPLNTTFATNPDSPAPGLDLYRFSEGHGGLRCESCHGSTHAVYPSIHGNDNIQVMAIQGHRGTLSDCDACHDPVPNTVVGGPHGMHPIGDDWVDDHGDAANNGNHVQCQACHGTDYRGTVLSRSLGDRTYQTQFGTKHFWRGFRVSCYACHDGPTDDDNNDNHPPVVSNVSASTIDQPVTVILPATDQDGTPLTLRVITQPLGGTVAISGNQATYYPQPGIAGQDTFTFAAWDGESDSNLGTVVITREATWSNYGRGFPGTGGVVPALTANARPVLGTTIDITVQNTSGTNAFAGVLLDIEPADIPSPVGGSILVTPAAPFYFTLPAAGTVFSWALPATPSLTGVAVYGQVIHVDPGAEFGVAFSRGIRFLLGP